MYWVFFAIGLVCMVLAILRFGNPQFSRWIYIFQAYIWSGAASNVDSAPSHFTGTWRTWYENGSLKSEEEYEDGVRSGASRRWHPEGSLRSESTFLNGKEHGVSRKWFTDGREHQTSELIDGRLHGKRVFWDPSGFGWELGYDHGELHGPWFFLNRDGTRTDGGVYDHGKVVAGQAYRELY